MSDDRLANRRAELEEELRLLTIENEQLAERVEETRLLGLVAEKINVSNNVDELIGTVIEQVAVMKNIPYVGCYAVEDGQAWLVHEHSLVPIGERANRSIKVEPGLVSTVAAGGCHLVDREQEQFSLRGRTGTAFEPSLTILLPLRNQHGRPLFLVFATDRANPGLTRAKFLLPRIVEMLGARVENLALLDQLTQMNEGLDQKVQERTEELRASENRLRTLFEGAIDAFFVVDTQLNIRDVNRRACENLGYTREELLGMKATDIRDDAGETSIRKVSEGAGSGEIQILEARHRRKDGSTFPVEVRAGGLEIDGQPMMLAQARDVSERNRLLAQLHQAQKMEAVGRLAGGIAHDFNNILTAIMGQLDLLKMDVSADPAVLEGLDLIQQSSERAAGLTKQLLAFSRKQVLDMKPQNLSRCIAATSRMLLRVVDETVDLKLELDEDAGCIYGDQIQIEQILMNLVINARDAMPDGGRITISTRRIRSQSDFLASHSEAPTPTGHYVLLSVTDTGEGIPYEIQDKIFDPFFTTKEVGRGTGLGLALVYSVAQQHHARIRLRSEPGGGATFEIIFPEIAAQSSPGREVAAASVPHGDETILLVEDDDTIRSVVARMIRNLGYKLLTASDGTEALSMVAVYGGNVDLVLTDVIMPRMGGPEMVRELKARYAPLRVIYMSGYTDDMVGREDLAQPGTCFVQKPISFAGLAAELRSSLDRPLEA